MTKATPKSLRDTLLLFAFYRPEIGLRGMLEDVDFQSIDLKDIIYAAHGRAADETETAEVKPGRPALRSFLQALLSDEFRANIVPRFLAAFPEKKRLLFVHIPKTAGAEVRRRLGSRYPLLYSQLADARWRSPERFFLILKHLVLETLISDSIFVAGHNTLARYREWGAIRPNDRIFAVVRQPQELIISQVNYILTRIFVDEKRAGPDSRSWRRIFEVADPSVAPSKAEAVELARKVMRRKGVVPPNVICRFLGDGTAEAAIHNIAAYNVEITDLPHYDAWFRERWDITRQTRSNASQRYIEVADLSGADLDHIASITTEDMKVYELVRDRLERTNTAWFIGGEPAEPAARRLAVAGA